MPGADSYGQKIPRPLLSDGPDIETGFLGTVDGLASRSVMRFDNANARAAALSGKTPPVPGMITYLVAEDRWDAYTGDKRWIPLSPGPWKPLTFASGYSANSGSPGYRILNGEVQLRGTIKRTSGAAFVTDDETAFATIPAEARPTGGYRYFPVSTNFSTVNGVSYFTGRAAATPDGSLMFTMPINSKATWLSLDNVRYSLD